MESILIDPFSHPKTSDYMLTSKQKKKCLQFFRAKSELLDDLCDDIELWELFVNELNDVEKQMYTKTEYLNAIQTWKSSITSSIPTNSSYIEEDEQLQQVLYRLNAQMVEPTENHIKFVLRCLKTNSEQDNLWSRIAARLNILSKTKYSIPVWQRTFEQFTRQLVAKKNLSDYLTNKYGKSPLTMSLTKIEQNFLKESVDRVTPSNDNLLSRCRICLALESSEMIYIFDHGTSNAEDSLFYKLSVSSCFDVAPELDDGLPQYICINCSNLVENAYQLRTLCLKNEEKLRELANQEDQFINELFDSECHDVEMEIDYNEEPIVVTVSIENDYSTENAPDQHSESNKQIPPKNFLCEECGKSFLKINQLRHHLITHGNIRSHICKICHKAFKLMSSWKNHQAVHKKIKDIKCTECSFATNTIYNLRVHERTHRDIQGYACSYCEMKFKTASNQLKHMRGVHQKQRSLKCDQCECAYFNRESLRRHTVVHTGARPFDCAVEGCSQNYLWYSGLRKHMLQFHKNDNVAVPTEKYYLDKFFDSLPQK